MEKIQEIEKNTLLKVTSWGSLGPQAGSNSTIITNDKKLYYYCYSFKSDNQNNSLSEGLTISDELFSKVTSFIEKEVINKKFNCHLIFDAGFDVLVNYNGTKYDIKNDIDFKTNTGLYNKACQLIKEIEKEIYHETNKNAR